MLESIRYCCNVFLCFVGGLAYVVLLGWTVFGVWSFGYEALKTIILMMTIGLPVPSKNLGLGLFTAGLAGYYSLTSPLIVGLFRRVPVLRPVLIVGFVFLLGLVITYSALFQILNAGIHSKALAITVGTTGIVLTRLFMAWLFEKVPVEALAFRYR